MKLRMFLSIVAVLVALGAASAVVADNASVKAAFEQMWEDENAFSPEFRQLLDEDMAIADKYDLIPCVPYDLWVHDMGACPEDTHEVVNISDVTDFTATVDVKVTNCGNVTIERFLLIKVDGQWRVDDIVIDGISEKESLKECLREAKRHYTASDNVVCVTGNNVRLRWSPEIKSDNIVLDEHCHTKYFSKGDTFKYLADAGDFYEVSYNGAQAYISKQFSRLESSKNITPNIEKIRKSYIAMINRAASRYSTPYVSDCGYFLYDITGDGVPELWVNYGTCEADYQLDVYTYNGREASLLFNTGYGHSYCCAGKDYVLIVCAHMGCADWRKLTYSDGAIRETRVFVEEDVENYTDPAEPMINPYLCTNLGPINSMIK